MNESWLAHHGIAGQRWGHKNGPPYPLHPEDHDASERKAGWKKSLDNATQVTKHKLKQTRDSVSDKANQLKDKFKTDAENRKAEKEAKKKPKKELTPEQIHRRKIAKRIAIGTAAVAGTALAIYGAKKLNDSAVAGLSKSYKYAAQEALRTASDYRRIDKLENVGKYGRQKDIAAYRNLAKEYQNKVRNKDFSMKEKIDYHLNKTKVKGANKKLNYDNMYGYKSLNDEHLNQLRAKLKSDRSTNVKESYKEAAKEARNMIKELERDHTAGHEASNQKSIEAYKKALSSYENKIKNNDFSLKERAGFHATHLKNSKNDNYVKAYGLNKLGKDWNKEILGPNGLSNSSEAERYKRIKYAKKMLGKIRSKNKGG